MLTPFSIPRIDGVPHGRYRLLLGTRNEAFFGVTYVEGKSVAPVDGRTILRQHQAFGDAVKVEPWDIETARACRIHLEKTDRHDLIPLLDEWIASNDPDRAPASTEETKADDLTVDESTKDAAPAGAAPAGDTKTDESAPALTEPATPPADGLDELTLEQLREHAVAAGIVPGNKQEKALIKLLRRTASDRAPASAEATKA